VYEYNIDTNTMTKLVSFLFSGAAMLACLAMMASPVVVSASMQLPPNLVVPTRTSNIGSNKQPYSAFSKRSRRAARQTGVSIYDSGSRTPLAMAIPGYGVTEQIFVGGFSNFLSIFNTVITARILLSWFPQAQGIGFLQPVFAVTDPYLNLFRGLLPPVFGLDLSPLLAFFALNVAGQATAAIGCELPNKRFVKPMSKRNMGFTFGRREE